MPVAITEAPRPVAEALKPAEGPGRFLVQIISPGWGSSGYYSQEVLEAAGRDRVWPAGTHMYLDHPTESENYERPERSVRDLVAVLDEDAHWDTDLGALVAETRVFSQWRQPLAEMAESIGVSIRGSAEGEMGEAEGRRGLVFSRLVAGESVDFVTHAGRGGKVVQVLESARATARAIERGVSEATANDRREQLSALVSDTYGRQGSDEPAYVWVRDFDDSTVWFEARDGLFQQAYTTTNDIATALTGDRVEVRVQTRYAPVGESAPTKNSSADPAEVREAAAAAEPTPPAVEAGTTPPHKKETPMGNIQVDEARVRDLEEKAATVPALEARVTAAEARADAAEQRALQAEAGTYARDFARTLVTKANGDLAEASVSRIVKTALAQPLPLDESGRLDTAAFTPLVEAARTDEETYLAQVAEASGVGSVRGVGPTSTTSAPVSEADVDTAIGRAFGRKGA